MKRMTLLFLSVTALINAGLEEHLKPIHNKTTVHAFRNIDFIYTINLDKRPEKFQHCVKQLAPYGITPFRFSAVNGWDELTLDVLNDLGVCFDPSMKAGLTGTYYSSSGEQIHEAIQTPGRVYFSHCMAKGAIACTLSHLSVLQDALTSGYNTIWVMEDDIDVVRDPHDISRYIDYLDSHVGRGGWDVLYTDPNTKNDDGEYVPAFYSAPRPNFPPLHPKQARQMRLIGYELRQIGCRYGTYSMIIRRSGMKKILDFYKTYHIFYPYDMELALVPNIKLFTTLVDVVSTVPNSPSDNGRPAYSQSFK